MTDSDTTAREKMEQFDGIRGFACLLVLVPHMRYFGFYLTEFFSFGRFAQFGLYVFFFLSTYLISRSVFSESHRHGLLAIWPSYIARRLFRIVPLYLAVLLIDYFWFQFYFGTSGSRDLYSLIAHATFLEGRSALWTMPVEVRFYLLLIPLMFVMAWALRQEPNKRRFFAGLAVAWGTLWHGYTYLFDRSGILATWGVHSYAPYFVFGVLFSALREAFSEQIKRSPDRVWNVLGAAALALFIAQNPYWWQTLFPFEAWQYDPRNIDALTFDVYLAWRTHAMVFLVALILLAADRPSGLLKSVFSSRPLAWVGKYSFGIYLIHMPVIMLVRDHLTTQPQAGLLLVIVVTSAIAVVLHHVIERPGVLVGNRVSRGMMRFTAAKGVATR